ncbi:hypothetical protein CEV34_3737 [Brucella pseudogrignonensis]|uniref:Uncharacterized protein n=1 Tax=Brucella pseudogrignonensis TaxID=419475 RepID=A0A256G9G5_9HYPH|nr:hypothetical protein CEV34_3737 [Brucella pseudogrignonensis]
MKNIGENLFRLNTETEISDYVRRTLESKGKQIGKIEIRKTRHSQRASRPRH